MAQDKINQNLEELQDEQLDVVTGGKKGPDGNITSEEDDSILPA